MGGRLTKEQFEIVRPAIRKFVKAAFLMGYSYEGIAFEAASEMAVLEIDAEIDRALASSSDQKSDS